MCFDGDSERFWGLQRENRWGGEWACWHREGCHGYLGEMPPWSEIVRLERSEWIPEGVVCDGTGPRSQGLRGWWFRCWPGESCCRSSSQRARARSRGEAGVGKKETHSDPEIWNPELQSWSDTGWEENTSNTKGWSVQSWLFATPWTAARQASLSITTSWSLLKLMSMESVMPSNHLKGWYRIQNELEEKIHST